MATPPGRDNYWDKLLQPAAPVWAPAAPAGVGKASPTEEKPFVLERAPIGGYLGLVAAVIVLTAIDNRDGSRWYFASGAVLIVLAGALLYWWRSQFAPTRVVLVNDGRTLLVITRRQTTQIPVAALIRVDPEASALAQFFGWRELTLHHVGGRTRIGRPQDAAEFYWQLARSNPTLPPEPPPTGQRPWIVAVALGLVAVGALAATAFSLEVMTLGHAFAGVRIGGLILLATGLARLALCYWLWAGYRNAWRFFMVLVVADGVLTLMWDRYPVGTLIFQIVTFAVLTSPGVHRWASD